MTIRYVMREFQRHENIGQGLCMSQVRKGDINLDMQEHGETPATILRLRPVLQVRRNQRCKITLIHSQQARSQRDSNGTQTEIRGNSSQKNRASDARSS